MRKTISWAAIVLLLVVGLNSPVMSRLTPYPVDDQGPTPDHPWGGEQNSVRDDPKSATTVTGIPVIDVSHGLIFKWLLIRSINTRPAIIITQPNSDPITPQTNNNANNSNLAN